LQQQSGLLVDLKLPGDDVRVAAARKMPPPAAAAAAAAAVGIEDVVVRCGEEGGGESMIQACSELAFCGGTI
jgi:hypothetical protein